MLSNTAAIFVSVVLAAMAACAPSQPIEPRPELDMAKIKEILNCPMDRTPVCAEYMGKKTRCFCADSDAMQEILEPDKQP